MQEYRRGGSTFVHELMWVADPCLPLTFIGLRLNLIEEMPDVLTCIMLLQRIGPSGKDLSPLQAIWQADTCSASQGRDSRLDAPIRGIRRGAELPNPVECLCYTVQVTVITRVTQSGLRLLRFARSTSRGTLSPAASGDLPDTPR